jgi:hypothetical protein
MRTDADEDELFGSVELSEWSPPVAANASGFAPLGTSSHLPQRSPSEYSALEKKTWRRSRKGALAEGLPYQTLICSLLHKYASGRLKEV